MDDAIIRAVRRRANRRCEYCRISEREYRTQFQVDHIIARKHGGREELSNLAWSCLHCNSFKGPNIAGLDPTSGRITPLFHPRRQLWATHFRWDGPRLIGRTGIGRATIATLRLNAAELVYARHCLIDEGVFPPKQ